MNILIINEKESVIEQINEFTSDLNAKMFCSERFDKSMEMITSRKYDLVIIKLNSIFEIGILKYLNDYHKDTKVILTVKEDIYEAISILQKGEYSIWNEPFSLQKLKLKIAS